MRPASEETRATPDLSLPPKTERVHLAYLDSIRALAALWVVLDHLCTLYQTPADWPSWTLAWTWYANIAVGVFIVLSGFCLMLPVARDPLARIAGGMRGFLMRRARRILPPFYAALGLSMGLVLLVYFLNPGLGLFTWKGVLSNALMVQNVLPDPRINSANPPLWSVSVEWRIYFYFPLMVWLWRRRGPVALLAATLAYTTAVHWVLSSLWLSHLSRWGGDVACAAMIVTIGDCPWYLWMFALGMCAAGAAFAPGRGVSAAWLGRTLALFGLALVGLLWAFPLQGPIQGPFLTHLALINTVLGVVVAAVLLWITLRLQHRPQSLRLLHWKPLIWLGTFSYSLYLIHFPALTLFGLLLFSGHLLHRLVGPLSPLLQASPVSQVLGLGVSLGASYLFFLAFERPFLRRRAQETAGQLARDAALSPAP